MTAPRISIALCTYNGSRFLPEQLSSYVSQERWPDELVVCDDGSTDDTLAIVGAFAKRAPFPVRIHAGRGQLGVSANFSRAIGLCTGDFIALSDQDDIWRPRKLRRIAEVLEANPSAGLVFTDADAVDEFGTPLGYRLWDAVRFTRRERRAAQCGRLLDVLLRHYVVTGATLAFRAAYRDLVLPVPPDALHDAWIGVLIAAVADGQCLDEPLIGYRQHANQASGGERVLGLLAQARKAREQTEHALEETASRFALARSRLAGSPYSYSATRAIGLLDGKIKHFRARASMRRPGTFRLPLIAREAIAGRYARFSHAWKGIAADLLL